jgi:hypothetical protein
MLRRNVTLVLVTGLLLLGPLAAACGGPGPTSPPPTPTVAAAQPGVPATAAPVNPPVRPAQAPPSAPVPKPAASGCHPAYPTVCVPAPPPDLDCKDIPYRNFRVDWRFGDPHRFDADRDGIGCEGR